MTKIIMVLAAALALAGCVTDAQREAMIANADDGSCQSYGAAPGTQAYFQCRMMKDQQRQAIQAQNAQVAAAFLMSR